MKKCVDFAELLRDELDELVALDGETLDKQSEEGGVASDSDATQEVNEMVLHAARCKCVACDLDRYCAHVEGYI